MWLQYYEIVDCGNTCATLLRPVEFFPESFALLNCNRKRDNRSYFLNFFDFNSHNYLPNPFDMNSITFNHNSESFFESVSVGERTLKEHFHVHSKSSVMTVLEEMCERLNNKHINIVETVKFVKEEITDLSMFLSVCVMLSGPVLELSQKIKLDVSMTMIPCMRPGGKVLSKNIEDGYNAIKSNKAVNQEDSLLIAGIVSLHVGMIASILDEFEAWQNQGADFPPELQKITQEIEKIRVIQMLSKALGMSDNPEA